MPLRDAGFRHSTEGFYKDLLLPAVGSKTLDWATGAAISATTSGRASSSADSIRMKRVCLPDPTSAFFMDQEGWRRGDAQSYSIGYGGDRKNAVARALDRTITDHELCFQSHRLQPLRGRASLAPAGLSASFTPRLTSQRHSQATVIKLTSACDLDHA